jgi:hypothetical protein
LTLEDGNKLNKKLSFKMTTTENNMDEDMKETAVAHGNETFEAAEEGKLDEGLRNRGQLKSKLSVTSRKYDVDGDGQLDEAEQNMRDMDTDNRGYLTNEEVYKVMVEQMKLQREVFSLKRLAMVFLVVMVFLSLATLATSFAAATLAKDTDVKNGVLVKKDSNVAIATSTADKTFIVSDGTTLINGRRTQASGNFYISLDEAVDAWTTCSSMHLILQRYCTEGTKEKTVEIPICPSNSWSRARNTITEEYVYTFERSDGNVIFDCQDSTGTEEDEDCVVTFPSANGTVCEDADNTELIDNGSATPVVVLGTASNYAILSKTGISTVPPSDVRGNIAVSPIAAEAITGFTVVLGDDGLVASDESNQVTGSVYAASYGGTTADALTTAVSDMEAAYNDAKSRPNSDGARMELGYGDLGGALPGGGGPTAPLTRGVYTWTTDVRIVTDLYFEGSENDVFIMQIAQKLVVAGSVNVILQPTSLGTPKMENIFWQVAGAITVGKGAHMEGIFLGQTSVTFVTGASLNGRILAQTACVLDSNDIFAPDAGVGGTSPAVVGTTTDDGT